jgi:hypothetical protein
MVSIQKLGFITMISRARHLQLESRWNPGREHFKVGICFGILGLDLANF